MTAIDQIKQELRDIIELSAKATPGEWNTESDWPRVMCGAKQIVQVPMKLTFATRGPKTADTTLIAASRNLTPKMARALLTTIDAIETALHYAHFVEKQDYEELAKSLETIRREWEGQA